MRNDYRPPLVAHFVEFARALTAELLLVIDGGQVLSAKAQRGFQRRVNALVNSHYLALIGDVREAARAVIRQSREDAYRDAGRTMPALGMPRVSLREIEPVLKTELLALGLDAVRQLRRTGNHQQMLQRAGLHPEAARVRAREGQRLAIKKLTRLDRRGRKIPAAHRFALVIGEFLNQLALETYLKQASSWGYTQFEVWQPDHDRHGQRFDLAAIPSEAFHPQSTARAKLVKEVA